MIVGRYGTTTGRPYVEGRLIIPSQNLTADISFILDTGADTTVLMPMDGTRMGLDYSKLNNPCQSLGVGGYSSDFEEDAFVVFLDAHGQLHMYGIRLRISAVAPEIMTVPCLLGRNVLDRWKITYDPSNSVLEAEVRSADVTMPVPPPAPPPNNP